jgi:hypothetical protein
MPRTRSSSLEIFTLSMGPDDMTSRTSRHMTTRPPRLMTARPSRLRLGPAMPITRSSSFQVGIPGQNPKIANSSCPSTGLSKTSYVHPLLARIGPSFGFTTRTQRPLRQFLKMHPHEHSISSLDTSSAFQRQPSLVLHCSCFPTDFPCGNLKPKTLLLPNLHREHPSNSISARMIQSYVITPWTDSSPSS